ncbi:MAG TPA: hypothetical protein VNM37_13135 [Candidatus Dormibacteraeota bacterium]|nr:hypothetical protein [Candidatus Dormibacteraeota bacterium]
MPYLTIHIDERQEAQILEAVKTNRDFIIDGGAFVGIVGTNQNLSLEKITFTLTKCPTCKGRRSVKVLGGGGDYEDWPCSACRPEEHAKAMNNAYHPGSNAYDGSAD